MTNNPYALPSCSQVICPAVETTRWRALFIGLLLAIVTANLGLAVLHYVTLPVPRSMRHVVLPIGRALHWLIVNASLPTFVLSTGITAWLLVTRAKRSPDVRLLGALVAASAVLQIALWW